MPQSTDALGHPVFANVTEPGGWVVIRRRLDGERIYQVEGWV